MFENMFDGALPKIADLAELSDAELVGAAGELARGENALCARKLAVMAEIFARRTGLAAGDRELWWVDPQAAVAAEMAVAVNVSQGMALHQTHRGVALRDRLPQVARLFAEGVVSDLLVRTIVFRTYLITDQEAMAKVDAALADRVSQWGALSTKKTEAAIDELVDEHDPGALRRSQEAASQPTVQFGSPSDVAGTTSIWARLASPDAALIEQRTDEMAHSVCEDDPRGLDERRASALTALAERTELACACGEPDCPGRQCDRVAKNAVVYVVADERSVDAAHTDTDPIDSPTDPPSPIDPPSDPTTPTEQPATTNSTTPAQCAAPPAFVLGAGVMPAPLLAATLERATIREVRHRDDTTPEPRYTPSRALGEFVRCRDLTCRFPGCDKPAQFCDIDHTVAYPVGPTHPSNLKCLCRFHHLLKTFWNGAKRWRDRQLPDGTVILPGHPPEMVA